MAHEHRQIIEVASRICCACKVDKPSAEFDRDRSNRNGIQARCKECRKARNKKYARDHPDYFRLKQAEYAARDGGHATRYARHSDRFKADRAKYGATLVGRLSGLLLSARDRARKRSVDYSLDFEWLAALWVSQKGCCALTGIELDLLSRNKRHRSYVPFSPSLDRIDGTKGYTPENTRLVCTAINIALNHFGEEVFAKVCKAYLESAGIRLAAGEFSVA